MNALSTNAAAKNASLKFRSLRSIRAKAAALTLSRFTFCAISVLTLLVTKQRFLNTPEELIQSLVAAGLSLQHPPAFPLRLIGHALNRPTDCGLGSDRGEEVYQPQRGTKSTSNTESCFLRLDFQVCYRNLRCVCHYLFCSPRHSVSPRLPLSKKPKSNRHRKHVRSLRRSGAAGRFSCAEKLRVNHSRQWLVIWRFRGRRLIVRAVMAAEGKAKLKVASWPET